MYQRLIEVCRQAGISGTFIKANLSAPAPGICGSGSLRQRKPTDTAKHIIPRPRLAPSAPRALSASLAERVPLPLRPAAAMYLSLRGPRTRRRVVSAAAPLTNGVFPPRFSKAFRGGGGGTQPVRTADCGLAAYLRERDRQTERGEREKEREGAMANWGTCYNLSHGLK